MREFRMYTQLKKEVKDRLKTVNNQDYTFEREREREMRSEILFDAVFNQNIKQKQVKEQLNSCLKLG